MSREPLILAAARSPFGLRHGRLASWHPSRLLAEICKGVISQCEVPPEEIDGVMVGCATTVGAQAGNLAAYAASACGCRPETPAAVVSALDISSLTALVFAADAAAAGRFGLILVAGIEVMSLVPAGAERSHRGFGRPAATLAVADSAPAYATAPAAAAADSAAPFGLAAELWAESHGISREELDAAAEESRRRASAAAEAGRFEPEILPLPHHVEQLPGEICRDELFSPREPSNFKGIYREEGLITAASTAPMADGAAAVLLASSAASKRLGLHPVARVLACSVTGGSSPYGAGSAPTAAKRALASAGVELDDLIRVELGEPAAASLLNWRVNFGDSPEILESLNPDGGSLALGHPQGATGIGLVVRLLRALTEDQGGGLALAACDASDGGASAVLLES